MKNVSDQHTLQRVFRVHKQKHWVSYAAIQSVHPQCADGLVHLKPWAAAALTEWGHYGRHIRNEKSAQRDANTARCVCRRGPSSISVRYRMWNGQLFLFKSYLRVKNFEISSRDSGHAHLGVGLNSLRRRGPPFSSVYQVWSGLLNSFKSYQGVPKLGN